MEKSKNPVILRGKLICTRSFINIVSLAVHNFGLSLAELVNIARNFNILHIEKNKYVDEKSKYEDRNFVCVEREHVKQVQV
jgi:hypothetical protein